MSSPASGTPSPPPEAVLIQTARKAQAISPETAAARMPFKFSGTSWRQIEAGYRGRIRIPVKGNATTLAHMARTVGVSRARMAEVHPEAAKIMREIEIQEAERTGSLPDPLDHLEPHLQRAILEMLSQIPSRDRGSTLRRLAERIEAGELPPAEPPVEPGRPQHPRRAG